MSVGLITSYEERATYIPLSQATKHVLSMCYPCVNEVVTRWSLLENNGFCKIVFALRDG